MGLHAHFAQDGFIFILVCVKHIAAVCRKYVLIFSCLFLNYSLWQPVAYCVNHVPGRVVDAVLCFSRLQCPGEGVRNGSVQPQSGHPSLQRAPEGFPGADQGERPEETLST